MKWLLIAAGAFLVLIGGALVALPWLIDTPRVHAYVSQAASQALGRPVRFASLRITRLPLPAVRLHKIEVAEDPRFGRTPFLTVDEAKIAIRLRPLLSGRIELADATVSGLTLALIEDGGQWNLASLGPPPPPAGRPAPRAGPLSPGAGAAGAAAVSRLTIKDGAVRYEKRGGPGSELRVERINVTLSAGREALAVSGDAMVEPGGVRLKISDGALVPVAGRPLGEAALRGALEVVAPDLTALGARVLASPRLAGAAEGTLRLSGTMARPIAAGDVRLRRLTLASAREGCVPATRQLVVEQVRAPVALTLVGMESARLEARAGGGTVSAQVRLAFAPGLPVILKDLSVKGVELRPILVDYLCQGFAVTGPLDLSGETAMRAADPWRSMAGAGRFRIGPGKVVGAEILELLNQAARLGGAIPSLLREGRLWSAGAPPDFKSISGTYRVDRGVLRSDDVVYESPAARITAAGAYALGDGRVDVVAIVASGPTEVRVRVAGGPGAIRIVPMGIRAGEPGGVRKLLDRVLR